MNGLAPDDPRHGTLNGYGNLHCRCDLCRAANARGQQTRRNERKARIALGNLGWTEDQINDLLEAARILRIQATA